MKKSSFDVHAEQTYYQADTTDAPQEEYLLQLENDMRLWTPRMESVFSGRHVLDIGAGKAPVGAVIARKFHPATVISFELVLRRLLAGKPWAEKLTPLKLVCGNVYSTPFPDASFDIVIANSVLHHLPDLPGAVSELSRVIKPGGLYIGREPNFNNIFVRTRVFGLPYNFLFRGGHSSNEYPLRAHEIERAFQQAGFHCDLHYFWRRAPGLRHPLLSAAISVQAKRL